MREVLKEIDFKIKQYMEVYNKYPNKVLMNMEQYMILKTEILAYREIEFKRLMDLDIQYDNSIKDIKDIYVI